VREPGNVVLPAFAAGGTSLVWTWFATAWTYAILAKPVIALGAMSLTAYVGHFAAQSVLPMPESSQQSWVPLLMFVLGATLFAATWSRVFRRGPLEYLLNAATKPARYIR
jgi:uncharacterized membrane protein YeiB